MQGLATVSVLSRAHRADIETEPFPHIIINDALDPDTFLRLRASRPDFRRIAWAGDPPDNKRFPYGTFQVLNDPTLDPVWPEFCRAHTGLDMFQDVMELFRDHLEPRLQAWLDAGHPRTIGVLNIDEHPAAELLLDARLEINTPVRAQASSVRGPHLDLPNRLYSGLL